MAVRHRTGAVSYDSRAAAGSGARTWIAFGAAKRVSLTRLVKPRSVASVPIVVTPPSNATPGDHLVGIFASITSRAKIGGSNGGNPKIEQRVALRTFIRVAGTLRSALTVSNLSASFHARPDPFSAGSTTVSYTVTNTGNVSLGAGQTLTVSGLFGSTGSAVHLSAVPVLLPGSSFPVKVEVAGVRPEIFMHANVTLTPDGGRRLGGPLVQHPVFVSTSFFAVPWLLLAIVLILVALVVYRILWRRSHPPSARHHRSGSRVPVASGKV